MTTLQRVLRIGDLRSEMSAPAWNRYLFQWHRSSHVVWALVLVLGTLLGGPPVIFILKAKLHLQNEEWLRLPWMGALMTLFFSVAMPIRRALAMGIGLFVGQCAQEWFRLAIGDDWRAFVVYATTVLVTSIVVTAFFRWRDARGDAHSSAQSGEPA